MPSKSLKDKVWIEYDEDGVTVKNPYKLLPAVATYIDMPQEYIELTDALKKALLCYCELDTLAMVFIWEYFYHMCNKK